MDLSNPIYHDLVTLVDEKDQAIGKLDKIQAHLNPGLRHRAASVFLFRKNQTGKIELLLQQRSAQKIVGEGQWANSACGNVYPDESYLDCAKRRLRVELGIADQNLELEPSHKFEYHLKINEKFSEWEIDQVLLGWYDGKIAPNPDEVSDYLYVNFADLKQNLNQEPIFENLNPNRVFGKTIDQVDVRLSESEEKMSLAPWFTLMMKIEEVQNEIDKYLKTK